MSMYETEEWGPGAEAEPFDACAFEPGAFGVEPEVGQFDGGGAFAEMAAMAAAGDMNGLMAAMDASDASQLAMIGELQASCEAGWFEDVTALAAMAGHGPFDVGPMTSAGAAAIADANQYTLATTQSVYENTTATYEASNDAFDAYLRE